MDNNELRELRETFNGMGVTKAQVFVLLVLVIINFCVIVHIAQETF
jgi:hypothetical protein